jgi:parallel beta-helix repeat protein
MTASRCLRLAFVVLLAASPCLAAVYVVDQASPAAADNNAGSEARPFKTITAGAAILKPGDTLYVKNGIYREDVFLPVGKPDAPVTLAAWATHHPVVTGTDIMRGPWKPADVKLTSTPAGRAPAIFTLQLPKPTQMIFVDDQPIHQVGPFDVLSPPEFIKYDGKGPEDLRPGTFCYDAKTSLLYLWLADYSNPADHRVEVQQRLDGIRLKDYDHVIGFEAKAFGAGTNKGQMCIGGNGNGILIESCRALYDDFAGILLQGDDNVIRNCEMAYNGVVGMTTSTAHRLLMENNVTHDNNTRNFLPGWCDGGIKLHEAHDSRIIRHRGYNEPGTALWLDISCIGALIADCTFENCANGIYYEISRWGIIVNNVCRNCNLGIWSYSSDVLIAHNLTDRCSHGILVTGDPRLAEYSMGWPDPMRGVLASTRNNMVVNNIIIDAVAACTGEGKEDADCGPNLLDYNTFVWLFPSVAAGGQHIKFLGNWNAYFGGLGNWWVAMKQDAHSMIADPTLRNLYDQRVNQFDTDHARVVGDPLFRNREGGDYRLMPNSPIRAFGRAVPPRLKSVYYVGRRPWEKTLVADAPDPKPTTGIFEVWGQKHYRHQPEPAPLMMFDPDKQPPVAPGPVEEWSRLGNYPRFELIPPPR